MFIAIQILLFPATHLFSHSFNGIEIKIVRGNIVDPFENQDDTKIYAIVNAANPQLMNGGGVAGAIFRSAGAHTMSNLCAPLRPTQKRFLKPNTAVITKSGNLEQKNISHVIHAVAPNFNRRHGMYGNSYIFQFNEDGKKLLEDTYRNVLTTAENNGINHIAIPFLCGGNFKPNRADAEDQLATIAVETVIDFCRNNRLENLREITFVLGTEQTRRTFTQLVERALPKKRKENKQLSLPHNNRANNTNAARFLSRRPLIKLSLYATGIIACFIVLTKLFNWY